MQRTRDSLARLVVPLVAVIAVLGSSELRGSPGPADSSNARVRADRALAFDECRAIDPDELRSAVVERAISGAPVKYHALAREIRLITDRPSQTLSPFAVETQGARVIVLTPMFAEVLCRIVLATFLSLEGIQEGDFGEAARTAGTCFETGQPTTTCIVGFSKDLERRYQAAFAELPEQRQRVALALYSNALNQLMLHEYAHHFLDHFERMKTNQISRIDAEFEADYFAIMNGVQSGEAASAMFYFFEGLAHIEQYTDSLVTAKYESGTCRSTNVANITAFMGVAPMVLLDVAAGGGYLFTQSSLAVIREVATSEFEGALPTMDPESCGRLGKAMLEAAFRELRELYLRVGGDSDFLLGERGWDEERANSLLRELSGATRRFRYLNGLAARAASLLAQKQGLVGGGKIRMAAVIDTLLDTREVTDNLLSQDYGRLLSVQGLAILQERSDLSLPTRIDRSFAALERAVFYNPGLTEAWANLAFIEFKRGDCAAAARSARRSVATANPGEDREIQELFATSMENFYRDPETCRIEGEKFEPYPGMAGPLPSARRR